MMIRENSDRTDEGTDNLGFSWSHTDAGRLSCGALLIMFSTEIILNYREYEQLNEIFAIKDDRYSFIIF